MPGVYPEFDTSLCTAGPLPGLGRWLDAATALRPVPFRTETSAVLLIGHFGPYTELDAGPGRA